MSEERTSKSISSSLAIPSTVHVDDMLPTATNSCHVCQDISAHILLEHPPKFWWAAPSPSVFWYLVQCVGMHDGSFQ